MKLFLKIFFSISIAAVFLYLLEMPVRFGLLQNKDFKSSVVQERVLDADALLVGPCQVEMNIDPASVKTITQKTFYNLGLTNANFADCYLLVHQYIKHQKKPSVLFLYVTPDLFDSNGGTTFNTYRFVHLEDEQIRTTIRDWDPTFANAAMVPFVKYSFYSNFIFYKALKGYLDHFGIGEGSPRHKDGFLPPANRAWEQPLAQFKRQEIHYQWSEKNVRYLKRLTEETKKLGVRLIFFELPIYRETENYHKNYAMRMQQIQDFAARQHIPFYRLSDLALQSDSTKFYSAFNVTTKGIEAMNKVFGAFIRDSLPEFCAAVK